jgi:hypothetical protein
MKIRSGKSAAAALRCVGRFKLVDGSSLSCALRDVQVTVDRLSTAECPVLGRVGRSAYGGYR